MESEETGKGVKVNMKSVDPNEKILEEQGLHSQPCMHMPHMHNDIKGNMERSKSKLE